MYLPPQWMPLLPPTIWLHLLKSHSTLMYLFLSPTHDPQVFSGTKSEYALRIPQHHVKLSIENYVTIEYVVYFVRILTNNECNRIVISYSIFKKVPLELSDVSLMIAPFVMAVNKHKRIALTILTFWSRRTKTTSIWLIYIF